MIYIYKCKECDYEFEHKQKLNDPKPSCPKCEHEVKKLPAISNFVLKGNGWAKDNYGLK